VKIKITEAKQSEKGRLFSFSFQANNLKRKKQNNIYLFAFESETNVIWLRFA
jgi:hypothetical protein